MIYDSSDFKAYDSGKPDMEITELIRNTPGIPAVKDNIKPEHLPIFEELWFKIDAKYHPE